MSLGHGASVVRDGLVLHLDAANVKSYPGSGNNAFDVSKYASGITFYNTPSITEKSFDFTALNTDGLTIASTNYSGILNNFTMEALVKINGTHQNYDGALLSSGNWNTTHWAFSIIQNNSGIRTRSPAITHSFAFQIGIWYHVVYRRVSTTINFFINGAKSSNYSSTNNIPLASDATNTAVGRETYAGGYFNFNGKIANAKIYNTGLTDEEVLRNFEALRGRYGI
jgi:hypothetical protein